MNTNYLFDQTFKSVSNNEPVNISREGWSHLHQKARSRMEMLSRYFALLKIPAIINSKNCRCIHEKGRDGNSEFWVLHGTVGKGEEKRAVSRLYPRCRGMITSQLFRKSILSQIGKLSIVKQRVKRI